MTKELIKYIVYAIFLSISTIIINNLQSKNNKVDTNGENDDNYVIKNPKEFAMVFILMLVLGLLIFLIVLFLHITGRQTNSTGMIIFSLSTATIGFLTMLWFEKFRIIVTDDTLNIHRLFRKPTTIKINDINKIDELTYLKQDIIIYFGIKNDKVIISPFQDNYKRLAKTLEKYGKPLEKNKIIVEVKGIIPLAMMMLIIIILLLPLVIGMPLTLDTNKDILTYILICLFTICIILLELHEIRKYLYIDDYKIKYRNFFITKELSIKDIDKFKYKKNKGNGLISMTYNAKFYKNNKKIFSF